jgi:hypothetical protein
MKTRLTTLLVVFGGLLVTTACSIRSDEPEVAADPIYVIEVTNRSPHTMAVSLDMGANSVSALGSVEGGQTKRFEVRDPTTNDVLLLATDGTGEHKFRKKFELKNGRVARVNLD